MKNADLFKDTFGTYATEIWSMPENDFLKWLNEDAEPKTGHWKRNETIRLTYCSECGFGQHIDEFRTYNYCPNCGAKMVEPQGRSDKDADKKCTYKETGCGSCKRQLDCPIEADKAERTDA